MDTDGVDTDCVDVGGVVVDGAGKFPDRKFPSGCHTRRHQRYLPARNSPGASAATSTPSSPSSTMEKTRMMSEAVVESQKQREVRERKWWSE